jgi:hypothetical protein
MMRAFGSLTVRLVDPPWVKVLVSHFPAKELGILVGIGICESHGPSYLACLGSAELLGSLGVGGSNYCGLAFGEWNHRFSDHGMFST